MVSVRFWSTRWDQPTNIAGMENPPFSIGNIYIFKGVTCSIAMLVDWNVFATEKRNMFKLAALCLQFAPYLTEKW